MDNNGYKQLNSSIILKHSVKHSFKIELNIIYTIFNFNFPTIVLFRIIYQKLTLNQLFNTITKSLLGPHFRYRYCMLYMMIASGLHLLIIQLQILERKF